MKFLPINPESEKLLAQILDHALRGGGLAVHHVIVELLKHMQDDEAKELDK